MIKVAIIGAGPRGLCLFERLTKIYEQSDLQENMEIAWIDPGEYGQGVHSARQPQYMLSNTVAGQISIFPDETVGAGPARKGPCLREWAAAEGYRNIDGYYCRAGKLIEQEIDEEEYVPRAILGEYLTWAYDHLMSQLPEGLSVRHYKNTANDLFELDNDLLEVVLDNGHRLVVHYALLATGHGQNMPDAEDRRLSEFAAVNSFSNPNLRYFRSPYPIEQLKRIGPDASVAIQGLGLCAHDIIAELTIGRGGRFVDQGARYIPSGREPQILVFSRSGLPYLGRQKGVDAHYEPRFFTRAAVDELRRRNLKMRGTRQLDFENQLWPLLVEEMVFAHHSTAHPEQEGAGQSGCEECRSAIQEILYPAGGAACDGLGAFTEKVREYLQWDIRQVSRDGWNAPSQAATDLLRDMRRNLRYAINFGGLTPDSHRQVMEKYWPTLSRLSAGPPKQRNVELLALLEMGIVAWAGGPNAKVYSDAGQKKFVVESVFGRRTEQTFCDVLIRARIDVFYPERDASPFVRNLLWKGVFRPYLNGDYHPGGIDVTEDHNPVTVSGRVMPNIWAIGNIVEGPNFFTHILPQTVSSGVIRNAGQCVLDMFAKISAGRDADSSTLAASVVQVAWSKPRRHAARDMAQAI